MDFFDKLNEDVRFREGLKACMNCGICTAICPAAEFYDYDPRVLITTVESRDNDGIEELLKSDTIWYCGQCMSCKTRCPRGNVPGMVVGALRRLSQELGYFVESRLGRQQYVILKTIGKNILEYGYCVHPTRIDPVQHPEQGPVWEWMTENSREIYDRLGANYGKDGPGGLRKIPEETLNELRSIIEVTGGADLMEAVEIFSMKRAFENGYEPENMEEDKYFDALYHGNDADD